MFPTDQRIIQNESQQLLFEPTRNSRHKNTQKRGNIKVHRVIQ